MWQLLKQTGDPEGLYWLNRASLPVWLPEGGTAPACVHAYFPLAGLHPGQGPAGGGGDEGTGAGCATCVGGVSRGCVCAYWACRLHVWA